MKTIGRPFQVTEILLFKCSMRWLKLFCLNVKKIFLINFYMSKKQIQLIPREDIAKIIGIRFALFQQSFTNFCINNLFKIIVICFVSFKIIVDKHLFLFNLRLNFQKFHCYLTRGFFEVS